MRDDADTALQRFPLGGQVIGLVVAVPARARVGVFVDLGNGGRGFVGAEHLPDDPEQWPRVGTETASRSFGMTSPATGGPARSGSGRWSPGTAGPGPSAAELPQVGSAHRYVVVGVLETTRRLVLARADEPGG